MCGIVDANTIHDVFGENRSEAGEAFFNWIYTGTGNLVVGGKLHYELDGCSKGFRHLSKQLVLAGRMTIENKDEVDLRTRELLNHGACRSNDAHVIALAQISGARLLYSNDYNLQQDFRDKALIDNPRGKVYTTNENREFNQTKRRLLNQREICRS